MPDRAAVDGGASLTCITLLRKSSRFQLMNQKQQRIGNHQLEAIRLSPTTRWTFRSPFAVVLVGQPTLRHRLRLGVLAALDQRIAVRYTIAGMSAADTADYIRHHCRIAGRDETLFSDDAIGLIRGRLTRTPARGERPRIARAYRRLRRRPRHRRRDRRGLNPTPINPTTTAST